MPKWQLGKQLKSRFISLIKIFGQLMFWTSLVVCLWVINTHPHTQSLIHYVTHACTHARTHGSRHAPTNDMHELTLILIISTTYRSVGQLQS